MAANEYGTTWWGREWLKALSGIDYANRIPRGKSYANTGKVQSVTLDEKRGLIKARVTGHYDPFYAVKITLPQVDPKLSERFIKELAASPVIMAALSSRELDPEVNVIAERLGINVFPRRWDDLKLSCSCPDVAVPCKHIAAVIYKLSQEIDANPFVLFTLRGIDILGGLEEYGLDLNETQVSEMPTWKELLEAPDPAPALPLATLNTLSFSSFEDLTASVTGLFTDAPPGYTLGSLKETLVKTLTRAQKKAAKALKDKGDRDLPTLLAGPLFETSAWGELKAGKLHWTIHPAGAEPYTQQATDRPDEGYVCGMFSGATDPLALENAPEEIEALYQVWLIALKMVNAGAVMPQLFEPIADCLAVRWIPAVISPEVQEVTRQVGQCLFSLKAGSYHLERAPESIGATALGQIALSLFINSFIHQAYHELHGTEDDSPDRAALFLGKVIDTDDYLNGESITMRLEAWLSPLYLEQLTLSPVIVFSDETAGALADFVNEKRPTVVYAEDEAEQDDLRGIVDTLFADHARFNGKEASSQDLENGPRPLEGTWQENTATHSLTLQERAVEPAPDPAALTLASASETDVPAPVTAPAAAELTETWLDGTTTLSESLIVRPENAAEAAELDSPDLFANTTGVGIAMGFREGNDRTFIALKEILEDSSHARLRCECLRTVARLSRVCPPLRTLLENHGGEGVIALEDLATVIAGSIPALRLLGVELIIPRSLKKVLTPSSSMVIGTTSSYDERSGLLGLEELLQFDWTIALGSTRLTSAQFETLSRKAGQIVRFRDQFVYVDPKEIARIARRLALKDSPVAHRRLLAAALTGKFGEDNVLLTRALKEALDRLLSEKALAVPDTLQATLRPYQERGYSWLLRNIRTTMGSILADDMGLGKTLQVIAALEKLRLDGILDKNGALIVVPTSLLINWERELTKFAPALTFKKIYGSSRAFKDPTHVTITTYGILRTELKAFKAQAWSVMIIDEAQAIKSHTSLIFKAVRQVKADAFIALSGTPVENRLLEYWSIMDFVNPGLLGSSDTFKREFATPIEREHNPEAIERFRNITAPFIMRRLKTDRSVISDLPDKLSYDRYCSLTSEQTALYSEVVSQTMDLLKICDKKTRSGILLKLITSLRMICNSPEQYLDKSPYVGPQYSGKSEMLFSILDEIFSSRRKALIFTQYHKTGELISSWLKERYGFTPDFLHGGLKQKERSAMVDKFQTQRDRKALVLSIKAAGTGLNLTSASAVIHFDLWWNPAVEAQATDRAYRIGQTRNVEVFRLISAGTFEEKVNALLESKKELAELTVAAGESWIGDLSNRQLEDIFAISTKEEQERKAFKASQEKKARA